MSTRAPTTVGVLGKLRPFTEGGSVTAGHASGINDAAGATVLMRDSDVRARGLSGLVTIEAVAMAGIEPELTCYGPPCTR